MCYHTAHPSTERLKKKKKIVAYQGADIAHVSGFSRPFLPVTLNINPDAIDTARWKLLPYWIKTEQEANKFANTLNADCATIFQKPSYKNYIHTQKGLLYIDGFYEPHQVAGQQETENFFIYMPKKEIFTLGIIWSEFIDSESGTRYPSFSIITTPANDQLAEIHNVKKRMPLIIEENQREEWLAASQEAHIKEFFTPYAQDLSAHQVEPVTHLRKTTKKGSDSQLKLDF